MISFLFKIVLAVTVYSANLNPKNYKATVSSVTISATLKVLFKISALCNFHYLDAVQNPSAMYPIYVNSEFYNV